MQFAFGSWNVLRVRLSESDLIMVLQSGFLCLFITSRVPSPDAFWPTGSGGIVKGNELRPRTRTRYECPGTMEAMLLAN